jgi:SagB-type dehydrogenase family enzyme
MNKDTKYAKEFHDITKHSELSLQVSHHYLDWDNKPRPFKIYTKLPSISLPNDFSKPNLDTINSISNIKPSKQAAGDTLNIKTLAEILFFSGGITREMKYSFGTYYMRAASATGALYPIEMYVVCGDIDGLKAGIYHFCPGDFTLSEINRGDYRAQMAEAAGNNQSIMTSPFTIIFTSIAWRNAWKYQTRSYRHWFWDSGVIVANLLATSISIGFTTQIILGFTDQIINQLLRLEHKREAAIALAAIGIGLSNEKSSPKFNINNNNISIPVDFSIPETLPLSNKGEVEDPKIWQLHEHSSLGSKKETEEWVNKTIKFNGNINRTNNANQQILEKERSYDKSSSLGEVILMRGSSRKFSRRPIPKGILNNILYSSTRGVPMDILKDGATLIDAYIIANDITDLAPGGYYYNHRTNSLELIKSTGASRSISGHLCLGQSLFSDASAVLFLMADLHNVFENFGNRGYRAVQFESGVIAGKIYLSSYAQMIGASGSTFYDDAVTQFFSPHAKDKDTMIAVGIGVPAYKARSGKILAGPLSREEIIEQYRQ